MSENLVPPEDHWFRADTTEDACVHRRDGVPCRRLMWEHIQSVGEWMEPKHFFVPSLRMIYWAGSWSCRLCGRHRKHGTHRLSREYRRLYGWRRKP